MLMLPKRMRTRSPTFATSGAVPGKIFPLMVKALNSVMTEGSGRYEPGGLAVLRVDHEHAHEPHRHLQHLVGMRVIHLRSVLTQGELVGHGLARQDMGLGEAGYPVHAVGG